MSKLNHRLLPALALVPALLAGSAANAEIEWSLVDPTCAAEATDFTIPCGDYGTFTFGTTVPPGACDAAAAGQENPSSYPKPLRGRQPFPVVPKRLDMKVYSMTPTQHPFGDDGDDGAEPEPEPGPAPRITRRVVAIDYDDGHGASVVKLIGDIVGSQTEVLLAAMDDEELDPLGTEVNDFHLLARLCSVAESVDADGQLLPTVVNMSFGRTYETRDPGTPTACDVNQAACQVAKVIQYLRGMGVDFIAAAGNHQITLFPAALENVASAGMLNNNRYFSEKQLGGAWETPAGPNALIPGNGLCIGDWPAPAGSSYSAAMLTGWMAFLQEHDPRIDPISRDTWVPWEHEALQCTVLSEGRRPYKLCNAEIDRLFDGLSGGNSTGCWASGRSGSSQGTPPPDPEEQPETPSLVTYSSETHPTPESDPCVPCEASGNGSGQGGGAGSGNDMSLNLSQSAPLPQGQILDSVMLRVDQQFYPLALPPQVLQDIRDAAINELVLPGWGPLLKVGTQPSFWYQVKTDPQVDCALSPWACFWSSTPITIPAP
ncbi:hypothetical protein ABI59_18105 [Acidobacteria bacterium Mor1]|nr:hypothetical protein ABI59_18105 [Acidobacteria bacterium Mor1]